MNQLQAASLKNLGLEVEEFPTYLDSDSIDKTLERYIFFPGDIIAPRRRQECREHVAIGIRLDGQPFQILANGGDEYQTQCLTRTKGFVPRAFITPLETAAYWIPPELLPYGAQAFSAASSGAPQVSGGVMVGTKSQYLVGEKVFPGHALSWMMSFARNDQGYSRGLVELEALRGQKWAENAASEIQRLYFPQYPTISPVLSELQAGIATVMRQQSGDVRDMGQLMIQACEEFRDWGINYIGREHTLVKVGTTDGGWTYTYSDTAKLLMAQLEITPQDQQFQTVAKMQEEMGRSVMQMIEAKGDGQTEMMKMFLEGQQQIAKAMQLLAVNSQLAAKEDPKPVAEKPSPKASK